MKIIYYLSIAIILISCTPKKQTEYGLIPDSTVVTYDTILIDDDKPLLDYRGTTTRYVEQDLGRDSLLGIQRTLDYFEINTYLRNNTDKEIKKIIITVIFRNKYSNSQDRTSDIDTYNSEVEINFMSGTEKNVTFNVFPKDDINMVYSYFKPERIIYSDGSYTDLQ